MVGAGAVFSKEVGNGVGGGWHASKMRLFMIRMRVSEDSLCGFTVLPFPGNERDSLQKYNLHRWQVHYPR